MAQLSKAAYLTKWADVLGNFADNTSRQISEGDLREFAQDTADSLFGDSGGISFLSVDIGDWDMKATESITVSVASLGVSFASIRSVSVIIRNDSDTIRNPIDQEFLNSASIGSTDGTWSLGSVNLVLARRTGGRFDSTSYDSTSYNRGYIVIGYAV